MQVVGVGSQDSFDDAQEFLDHTGIGHDSDLAMLWEAGGNAWRLNEIFINSSLQLFRHDLTEPSGIVQFSKDTRKIVTDAATQAPWAPPVTQ